ncbi:Prophage antirepressor [Pseudomonas sp. LAMO17WK12:I10]|uniref:BRO-N domain-containing protein n=1 Tax=unclassified Pseudomonas TaxID=196821 RepID=UPI000BDD79AC|nr:MULTISPECIES: BRO family protein [unclassified Pseudomonas]PXX51833.1 prophage antirepressor-like protein [Pseudomonas sp. LAMO17WK12:I9]SNY53618.1 Prophage antirepressor [Pseudomonas sp. LAMO17WK12:I10]
MLEKRQMPKTKKPRCGDTRASGNEINFEEEIVMSDNSTNVIPFNFGKQQVRTLLVGSDPWFSVQDILRSLDYTDSYKPARAAAHVPDQWKRVHRLHTLGGTQQALMLSEQGLYFFIGRSDKPKALPFQMWLAGEVLPAIRKHGRYEDKHSKMATLMDELIGMSELSVIKGLIRDKGKAVQADKRQSFTLTMHSRLHTRFNVPRTELIPAHQFESACNFIAAYALEGEYLGKEEAKAKQPLSIHYPVEVLARHKPEMVKSRGDGHAWLDVSLHDLRAIRGDNTPCEAILIELRRAGYEVDGAWWELRTYRNKMQEIASFARGLACVIDEPHRYAIKVGDAA